MTKQLIEVELGFLLRDCELIENDVQKLQGEIEQNGVDASLGKVGFYDYFSRIQIYITKIEVLRQLGGTTVAE